MTSELQELERDEVVPEVSHWNGETRYRCVTCNKIAFESEEKARAAAEKIWRLRKYPMRWHKGRARRQRGEKKGRPCGWWHLHTTKWSPFQGVE